MIRLGILSSSRADFGIYQPLIEKLKVDDHFSVEVIAFGTHLSPYHGHTLDTIEALGVADIKKVYGMPLSDEPEAIANAYGLLVSNFSQFWGTHEYDWVLALGDRFEMSAAVQAGIPSQVRFAHLHGGETTLGAIDNVYRHQITLASSMHFVATEAFAQRVCSILGHSEKVYCVGALSLDGITNLELPPWSEVAATMGLPQQEAFVLATFHPETVAYEKNEHFSQVAASVFQQLAQEHKVIITMPNADSAGSLFRKAFQQLQADLPEQIFLVENFGKIRYFAAMRQARFLIGNTSSAIAEAASFKKYAVNVGNRQEGRAQSPNILNAPFDIERILERCREALSLEEYLGGNCYYQPNPAEAIINHLVHAEL